jgi:glycosyltransferase involved in cell wall biosynthesis
MPIVSILMTAFNRAEFIGHAIESVLGSSFDDLELIVVDDASTDNTWDLVRKYQSNDSRIKAFRNSVNLGDYPNRNKAASYACGKYLKYVDSDDIIYRHGLATMIDCMESFPEAGLGLSSLPDPVNPCPILLSPHDAYLEHYSGIDLLGRAPGSTIIRRDAFEAVGGFSGKRQVGDHELWLTIARKYPVVKMPTDLVWDRTHPAQEKHYDNLVDKAAMHDEVRLAALKADDCPLTVDERAAAHRRFERERAFTYFRILRNGGGIEAANRYRSRAGLSVTSIGKAALKRVLSANRV